MQELTGSTYFKVASLKNGVRIVLRPFISTDRDGLLAFFKKLPREELDSMREDVTDPDVIDDWIKNMDSNRVFSFIAETGDQIIGDATLYKWPHGWHRHVGEIRLSVDMNYRTQGLGLLMASELVSLAMQFGLDKLVANVMKDQVRIISMLERLGFLKEAELKGHIMDSAGRKHDMVIMTNFVGALWERLFDSEFYQVRLNQMED